MSRIRLTVSNDANDEIREMHFQKLMKFSNLILFHGKMKWVDFTLMKYLKEERNAIYLIQSQVYYVIVRSI